MRCPQVPLIGFIGRLDFQKGADLVLAVVPWLMQQDVQLVCLGTGDPGLEVRREKHRQSPHPLTCAQACGVWCAVPEGDSGPAACADSFVDFHALISSQ